MSVLYIFVGSALAAGILTAVVRRYAIWAKILDVPNERSSHARAVPRGGGVAIILTFLSGTATLAEAGVVPPHLMIAIVGGGALVALVGWIDDRNGLRPRIRAAAHVLAAGWAVYWLGGLGTIKLAGIEVALGPAGPVLATLGIVWFVNLYNFMDGIDGIAAAQALSVGVAAAFLSNAGNPSITALALLLAGAAGGFLVWNWEPAKIFMGDAGSGFLGFAIAVVAVGSEASGSVPIFAWVMLSGVFVGDATITLVRRVIRGERWYDAHRSHAYQRLVIYGFSHRAVSAGLVVFNCVLAVLAWASISGGVVTQGRSFAGAILLVGACYVLVERIQPMRSPPRPTSATS